MVGIANGRRCYWHLVCRAHDAVSFLRLLRQSNDEDFPDLFPYRAVGSKDVDASVMRFAGRGVDIDDPGYLQKQSA